MTKRLISSKRATALAIVAVIVGAAGTVSAAALARAPGATHLAGPQANTTVFMTSRTLINYAHRQADGITDSQKYDQGDQTTQSWWEMSPTGTLVQMKSVTVNRDGKVTQEELVSGGVDSVYFASFVQTGSACVMVAPFNESAAVLPTVKPADLASNGYAPSSLNPDDRATLPGTAGRPLSTFTRTEHYSGWFVPSLRHTVVIDAEDGALYGDLVWAVAANGSETLWEARTHTPPAVVAADASRFTLPSAPICGTHPAGWRP